MGLFSATASAIKKSLSRTRRALGAPLRSMLAGRELDDAVVDEIEAHLIKADVGVACTTAIIADMREAARSGGLARGEDAIDFLKERLIERLRRTSSALTFAPTPPTVILVAGVNGSGKTTSVAKIAKSLRDDGRRVQVAAADTYRAGAVAQLEIWTKRLGVDIVKGEQGADPAAVVFDAADAALARGADVLLIDTAGRLHTQRDLMRQLTKVRDVAARKIPGGPHEVLLVLDATAGQNAIAQARQFQKAIDVTGIFLAKLDGTAKGGIVVAISDELGIPVKLIGIGERPEDVEVFDPTSFIEAMFAEGDA